MTKRCTSLRTLKPLARVVVIVVCIIALIAYFWVVTPWLIGWNQGISEFGEVETSGLQRPTLVMRIFDGLEKDKSIGFELHHILLPKNTCIQKILVRESIPNGDGSLEKPTRYKLPFRVKPSFKIDNLDFATIADPEHTEIDYGRCSNEEILWVDGSDGRVKGRADTKKATSIFMIPTDDMTIYYYPFDKRTSEINIIGIFSGKDVASNGSAKVARVLDYDIIGWAKFPFHDEAISISRLKGNNMQTVTVDLYRQQARRALTIVLLASILVFIGFLPFVMDSSSFVELSLGIVFGLWGIQGVLLPSDITGPSIIQSAILAMYLFYALAVFIRLFGINAWKWLNRSRQRNQ